jgi:hypothetical protein
VKADILDPIRPTGVPTTDLALRNWSDRNLRWLIDYLARLNDQGGRQYTEIQRKARELLKERAFAGEKTAERLQAGGGFVLLGVEGHEFGRGNSITDCEGLAKQMGLGLDGSGYFGHAVIQEV